MKNYSVSSVLLDQYSSFNTNGEMTQAYSYSNYYPGGFVVDDTTFTRNALGQITLRSTPAESQRWNYQYDSRGQVNKAYKTFISAPQQVAAGTQAQYTYDQIGNRLQWMEGGTSTLDSGLRPHTYGSGTAGGSANALNQYSTITQPQSFDVTGTRATGTTTIGVTAGTNPPSIVTYQQDAGTGLYFRADVTHNAASNTRYSPVNVTANSSTIDSWLQYVPPAAESLAYDADGNLTSDGRWTYKWDGENRLIRMDSVAQSNPTVKSMRLIFAYDGLSRRIRKDVYQDSPAHTVLPPTNGTLTKSEHYLYQGWNLVLTALDNGVGTAGSNTGGNLNKRVASYVWGPDIGSSPSGRRTWQGAGGVGGLLIVTDGVDSSITYTGVDYNGAAAGNGTAPADPTNDHYMPLIDHLGNITAYYSGVGGSLTLQGSLEYDAFGRETRSTGPACDKAPFHFSSKFTDPETGLNYYGYRFYDPNNGRWVNRDPIGEMGGLNLYGMVKNNGLGFFDALGLDAGIGIGRTIAAIGESASTAGGEATAAAMAEMVGAEMTGGGLASAIIGGTGLVVATIALTPLSETERRKALREECEEIQKRKEAAKAKNEAPNKQRRGRKPANCWAECSIFEDLLKNAIELLHLRKEWDDMDCDADLDWPGNETEADRRAKHLPELKAARNAVAKAEEALMECQNARARRQ